MNYPNGDSSVYAWIPVAYVFFIVFGLFWAAVAYVVTSWFLGRIFRKAGIEQWKAWVPVYKNWVFLELGGQPGWLSILRLIPIASYVALVFMCIAAYRIGIGFAKEGVWVVLYIFVSIVWLGILAFDSSRWQPWRIPGPGAPYGYLPPTAA